MNDPDFIELLAARSRAQAPATDAALDRALAQLDRAMSALAGALRVEYYGPEVGAGGALHVYRLVVREHALGPDRAEWGLKVCNALPHARWRAEWALAAAGRQRKPFVVRALPAFFAGYADAVAQAGGAETAAGRRVVEIARRFEG